MIQCRLPACIIRWSALIRRPAVARCISAAGATRTSADFPLAESEALLDELWSYATRDDIAWYNEWQPGDVVLWDNRCTMHRRDSFDPNSRRILYRTQIKSAPAADA